MVPLVSVVRVIAVVVANATTNGTVALLLVFAPEADCVTVMVVEPPDLGKTIFPHMSAIAVLLLVYV